MKHRAMKITQAGSLMCKLPCYCAFTQEKQNTNLSKHKSDIYNVMRYTIHSEYSIRTCWYRSTIYLHTALWSLWLHNQQGSYAQWLSRWYFCLHQRDPAVFHSSMAHIFSDCWQKGQIAIDWVAVPPVQHSSNTCRRSAYHSSWVGKLCKDIAGYFWVGREIL